MRQLRDGGAHRVIKIYYEPDELAERLVRKGWECRIRSTKTFFLYGTARPRIALGGRGHARDHRRR